MQVDGVSAALYTPAILVIQGENLLNPQAKVEMQQRIQKLIRCLGRSKTYSDGLSCFGEYNERKE
jgi:hypothetical protein